LSHVFPTPRVLARTDLTTVGVTSARAESISQFAAAIDRGDIDLGPGRALDETIAALRALRGFGAWTAHYVAMRACGERDAFPAQDLALRRALGDDPAARAEAWRPWRAYGAMHVWLGAAA
jgi:AraC family transcriptional regulator of adaptative response / DNA-3-methyladenine glycosylase II